MSEIKYDGWKRHADRNRIVRAHFAPCESWLKEAFAAWKRGQDPKPALALWERGREDMRRIRGVE